MTEEQRHHLAEERARLDQLDEALLELLRRRADIVDALWSWKRAQGLPLTDTAREALMKAALLERAREKGLDPTSVQPILDAIIGKALR